MDSFAGMPGRCEERPHEKDGKPGACLRPAWPPCPPASKAGTTCIWHRIGSIVPDFTASTDLHRKPDVVPAVLAQHAEDAVVIHAVRTAHTRGPHVGLLQLGRFDERLAANVDGLVVAGAAARPFVESLLELPSPGAVFVAAVLAIESRDSESLERLFALASAVPECAAGLRSAFGWVEPASLEGIVACCLDSPDTVRRLTGIAASAMHRVDPGLISARRLEDPAPEVRARALRCAGELGRHELVSQVTSACAESDPVVSFWAAWSAVLLGDRLRALGMLRAMAVDSGPLQRRALNVALLASAPAAGRELLRTFSGDPARRLELIWGVGVLGDPALVPWLVEQMHHERTCRQAGEAFSLITGADLARLDLERKPPEDASTGPSEDPDDPDVAMDPDEGLPWPDAGRVQQWWHSHTSRFTAGERYFLGSIPSPEGCIDVIRSGYQRQRMLAALWCRILQPGAPLFEWRAPAMRQQRAL